MDNEVTGGRRSANRRICVLAADPHQPPGTFPPGMFGVSCQFADLHFADADTHVIKNPKPPKNTKNFQAIPRHHPN